MIPRHRVYADFNGLQDSVLTNGRLALYLHYFGSLRDLSRQKTQLSDGLKLDVYSDSDVDEDLEATGVVHFDQMSNQWFVEFEEKDIRYVERPPEPSGAKFPCWNCSVDLDNQIQREGLDYGDTCASCGSEIHAVLNPPE